VGFLKCHLKVLRHCNLELDLSSMHMDWMTVL